MLRNFINGEWIASTGLQQDKRNCVDVINPANGKVLDQCPLGTEEDVNRAVDAAHRAFLTWRQVPAQDRVQCLFKLKTLMEENLDELARVITEENGKTLSEAKASARRAVQMVDTACGIPSLMMGKSFEDIAAGIDCIAVKRPMGVFVGIAPFNFPAMVPFWFWPFAVACGNTYVLKPSERVPLTQNKIFEWIHKAGFPPGVMNMVQGGKVVVDALCSHAKVQGISFVGSSPVAKHVYQLGTLHGKRVQALGGAKNFMVVLPDALMEKASAVALESIIGCAGERCLAGSVILSVGEKTHQEIASRITLLAKEITVGDGLDPKVQMGPLISKEAKLRVQNLIQSAIDQGARVLLDGRENVDHLPGYFLKPTVLTNVRADMKIAKEEVFGPVVCLSQVDSLAEAIQWINGSNYANTTTLFTTSGAAARQFSYEVDPSMIGINIGVPAPMSFFSFGGAKESFYGDIKAHGVGCVDFYTDTKVTIQRWIKDSSIW